MGFAIEEMGQSEDKDIMDLVDVMLLDKQRLKDQVRGGINAVLAGADREEIVSETVEFVMDNFQSQELKDLVNLGEQSANDLRKLLVESELDRAAEMHGSKFHSAHEGYGVILEELEEFWEDTEELFDRLDELWEAIRLDEATEAEQALDRMKYNTEAIFEELVQVMAMVEKFKMFFKHKEDEDVEC